LGPGTPAYTTKAVGTFLVPISIATARLHVRWTS
jgi:hypothetical protein